jgi:hypothetical protein
MKTGFAQGLPRRPGVTGRDVAIRNDGAETAEFEPRAFCAKPGKKTHSNLYLITSLTQRYMDITHRPSIRVGALVSKILPTEH